MRECISLGFICNEKLETPLKTPQGLSNCERLDQRIVKRLKMQRGQINFPAALESSDIYRWVTLLCLYYMYSLTLFNGHERCVFYRFQSKNGHNNDAAQKEEKTCQKKLQQRLHSVQIHQ